jgi:hypothetical protein
VLEARYGITRTFAVLGEIGYEHLNFGGLPPYRVDGMVWAGGVRLDPSPNTTVIARYRRRDGFDSPAVEARIGIGQRTVLFGSYIEQVTISLSQISDLLTTITVDEFGNPIGLNGAPVPDFGSTGFLGQQNGLYRSRRGTASISHLLPRDTFTLQYVYDRRTPVSVAPGNLAFEQQSQSLSLLWRRAISPLTTGFGSVGYLVRVRDLLRPERHDHRADRRGAQLLRAPGRLPAVPVHRAAAHRGGDRRRARARRHHSEHGHCLHHDAVLRGGAPTASRPSRRGPNREPRLAPDDDATGPAAECSLNTTGSANRPSS